MFLLKFLFLKLHLERLELVCLMALPMFQVLVIFTQGQMIMFKEVQNQREQIPSSVEIVFLGI